MSYPASVLLPLGSESGTGLVPGQVAPRADRLLQAALLPVGHPERRELLASILRTDLELVVPEDPGEPIPLNETALRLDALEQAMKAMTEELSALRRSSTVTGVAGMTDGMITVLTGFSAELSEFRHLTFEPAD